MILWPRTLLWRSVLLIAALLSVAHLAWLQIFRASEIEPRALQAAQQVVSVVNLTRAALVTADATRRFALLDELAQREGIQVYAGPRTRRAGSRPRSDTTPITASPRSPTAAGTTSGRFPTTARRGRSPRSRSTAIR